MYLNTIAILSQKTSQPLLQAWVLLAFFSPTSLPLPLFSLPPFFNGQFHNTSLTSLHHIKMEANQDSVIAEALDPDPLFILPAFDPKYRSPSAEALHLEQDQTWHTKSLSEWMAWGHLEEESEKHGRVEALGKVCLDQVSVGGYI
jgi:hypothetical protein